LKWLIAVLVALLLILQYRLWFGDGSARQYIALRDEARETHAELLKLRGRNQALQAEVADLKSGLEAIEERARTELGMIDENETFYQFVKKRGSEASNEASAENQTAEFDEDNLVDEIGINRGADGGVEISEPSQPIDADGSAAGRPEGPDGEQLPAPGAESNQDGN